MIEGNPFMTLKEVADVARDAAVAEYERKRDIAREMVRNSGVTVNDRVVVKWSIDQRHGGGQRSYTGRIASLDDWIRIENDKGYFYTTIAGLDSIEREQQFFTSNPFMVS